MGKNVLITGVSRGLGHGLAEYYLNQGLNVYALNRNQPDNLAGESRFHFASVDFSQVSDTDGRFGQIIEQLINPLEQIDLVVLNAGILNTIKDLSQTSMEEIQQVMQINVWANKMLIDHLCQSNCRIKQVVAISSGASQSGTRGWNAYALSKASLNMLIGLYAQEFSQTHFAALAPGLVDTQMQDYICGLEFNSKYPIVEKLKEAKGTEIMPDGKELAPRLDVAFKKLLELKSGSYADIRTL